MDTGDCGCQCPDYHLQLHFARQHQKMVRHQTWRGQRVCRCMQDGNREMARKDRMIRENEERRKKEECQMMVDERDREGKVNDLVLM